MLGDRDYMRSDWGYDTGTSRGARPMVIKLIIACLVIFVIQCITRYQPTSYTARAHYSWQGITSYLWLSVSTWKEFWRFGTYMFVHGGWSHVILNMWGLYVFGKPVEERIGAVHFVKLYVLSGLIGGLSWFLLNLRSNAPVLGASGAVFGVMAAAAMLLPDMRLFLLFPPVVLKVRTLVFCLAVIEVAMLYNENTGIAHLAHLGGLAGGFLYVNRMLKAPSYRPYAVDAPGIWFRLRSWWRNLFGSKRYDPDIRFVGDDEVVNDDEVMSDQIDPILDKIGKHGMKSLTNAERRILDRARERLKHRF